MTELFDCPRRRESAIAAEAFPGPDSWGADQTCSFCGSLKPSLLFSAIESGAELDATDKSYKLYVGRFGRSGQTLHNSPTGKFYFQHLSQDERQRFVELSNDGSLNMPHGWFYVLPFFMRRAGGAS